MPYISLTPTLRYRRLTTTSRLGFRTIARRMHFAKQSETLNNVHEINYAEIVSDTPSDTVMQELSELLRRLFSEDESRTYAKCYWEILTSSEEIDCVTLMSISKALPHCSTSWWITYGSGQTAQWIIRMAALPGKIPVTVKTTPSTQQSKKPFGRIIQEAIERIEREFEEKTVARAK